MAPFSAGPRAEKEKMPCPVCGLGTVVGPPRLLADGGGDADDRPRGRGRRDGVDARSVVACGDDDLHVVLLDQLVIEHGDRVRVVVERRQAADRDVDDVDAPLGDEVDHALGERRSSAPAFEGAGAGRDDLGTGSGTAHLAAEEAVAGDDAGDVRAVLAGDEADVDVVGDLADVAAAERREVDVLAVVDGEGHPLGHWSVGLVDTEVADLVRLCVRAHRAFVGEVSVLVGVDPDPVVRRVVEHREAVAGVAVTVQVTVELRRLPSPRPSKKNPNRN